jgi:hypothetical protein
MIDSVMLEKENDPEDDRIQSAFAFPLFLLKPFQDRRE